MPLPENDKFNELLASITREKPDASLEYETLKVIEERTNVKADNTVFQTSRIFLYFKPPENLTSNALIKRVDIELKKANHYSNEEIVKSILFLFSYHPKQKLDPIQSLNEILSYVSSCEVSLYYILPGQAAEDFKGVQFGDFELRATNYRQIKYKCKDARSDFFDLYSRQIIGSGSISRKPFRVTIINWHSFFDKLNFIILSNIESGILNYFEALSRQLFEDFWLQFSEQQNLQIAYGLAVINESPLRKLRFSQSLAIFNRIMVKSREGGYVVPIQVGDMTLTVGVHFEEEIKAFYQKIKEEYNFSGFEKNEVHESLKTFCRFVAKGARFLEEEKYDEGFLHYVIALDLLMGDKGESTKSVGNRCAVLTFKKMKGSFKEQRSLIDDLYGARSKYVHAGRSVDSKLIESAKAICKWITLSLLAISEEVTYKSENGFEIWKKKLDFVATGLVAGEEISDDVFSKVGIVK